MVGTLRGQWNGFSGQKSGGSSFGLALVQVHEAVSTNTTSPPSLTRTGSPGCGRVPSPVCTHTVTSPTSIPLWNPSSGRWGWVCSQLSQEEQGARGRSSAVLPALLHCQSLCPQQGCQGRDPRGNSQHGAQESPHTDRAGAATGWTRGHCPLCPHSLPAGSGCWPGHSCRTAGCAQTPQIPQIPQIPVPRGCTQSLLPWGHTGTQGTGTAQSHVPFSGQLSSSRATSSGHNVEVTAL